MTVAGGVNARASNRWRLILPLLLPSLGGLAYLLAFGARTPLIVVNSIALAMAVAWVVWGRVPDNRRWRLAVAVTALLLLFLPPLLHHDIDGVARWLPIGRVLSLHSGALLLPLVVIIAARERHIGLWLLAIAGTALALQPDAGALAGLAAASAALAWVHRSLAFALVAGGSLTLALASFGAGNLAPQHYTEGVLAHVADQSLTGGVALGLLLFGAPLWYLVIRPAAPREEGLALAALLAGFGLMATIAPFPYPLIGYGASPILGFGLALSAASRRHQHKAGKLSG